MVDLADGERGEEDADADSDIGLAGFRLASLPGVKVMGTGGDAGRLYIVGASESSEEDESPELISSDVRHSEALPPSMLLLRETFFLSPMSMLS